MKSEDGSVSVVAAVIAAVLVFVGAVSLGAAAVLGVKVRLQTAADLSALSAAAASPSSLMAGGGMECDTAELLVQMHGFSLGTCWVDSGDIRVVVDAKVNWMGISFTVTARARAGPAETP